MSRIENRSLLAVMDPASLSLGVASLAIQVFQAVKQGKQRELEEARDFRRSSNFCKDMHILKMPQTCPKTVVA